MQNKRYSFIPIELEKQSQGNIYSEKRRKSTPIPNNISLYRDDEMSPSDYVVDEEIRSILSNSECSSIITLGSNNSVVSNVDNSEENSVVDKEYINFPPISINPPLQSISSTQNYSRNELKK